MENTKLDEFVEKLHEEVDDFNNYWLEHREKSTNKELWPLEYDLETWFEQFESWLELKNMY